MNTMIKYAYYGSALLIGFGSAVLITNEIKEMSQKRDKMADQREANGVIITEICEEPNIYIVEFEGRKFLLTKYGTLTPIHK